MNIAPWINPPEVVAIWLQWKKSILCISKKRFSAGDSHDER
jgi:hypothetical protein